MAYSTQSDLEEQISQAELIELTDDAGGGSVDVSALTRAIADADAEIDSYCGGRYTMPFSPVPVIIRKLSVDIAVYNLFSRRAVLKIPEDRQKRYDNAIRFLRDVSKGLISLGADAPAEPSAGLPQATRTKDDRIFTQGKISGGSAGSLDNY
jgi:phage gp36-like protein